MQYPNNIKKRYTHVPVSYGNRGMFLEDMINKTNEYYINEGIALIYKKPTPIGVASVSFSNHKREIERAFFKEQSTLDYNGVYKGKYIDFDAKETKSKTAYPISNVHPHQIEHIRRVLKHQGIAFLIIRMHGINYLFKGEDFIDFIDNNDRKSIPYDYISEKGYIIKEGYIPALDYIKVIDDVYFKGE